ncbi:tRNA epoxyqueuosine(34) reductase QueG [Vitreimonas flagellata]|uniref:tRNA epoxyqueuosine(34) reductase QueG n=1 Tax=Vitreimonas flagellata TaxID=2560861 RepID=UPI001074E6F9|nr:tRNA epoxyqueuosine(34) reductase QueG [Vitreimonas flagellata]
MLERALPGVDKTQIAAAAARLGFDAIGVADARAPWQAAAWLEEFLREGRHGDMAWMAQDRRAHPQALWPDAKSAIVVGQSYAPDDDAIALLERKCDGIVSAYAARRDYHDVIKGKLKQLAQWLAKESGEDVKVFVDTAPLMEKPLAQRAGLGWQGKHTNLVSREHGSWLFLGAILSAAEIEPDEAQADHCGSCRACLDACPTAAFPAPYQLDARRCLAYLSIEHKGQIPREYRAPMGNRIYGCDDCLAVCPWNKFAQGARETRIALRDDLRLAPLAELAALDDAAFRARYAGTPVKRTGRDRFVRNVLVAVGNSGDPALASAAEARLRDESPLVRGMAVWALARLLDEAAFQRLKSAHATRESDASVTEEWG